MAMLKTGSEIRVMIPNKIVMAACVPIRCFYFTLMQRRQFWSLHRIKRYQERKLRKMIRYCWDYVPCYREYWKTVIADPREIQTIEDLQKLPIIKKEDIRNELECLSTKSKWVFSKEARTGGSTGQPIIFKMTRMDEEIAWAQMYVGWARAGYKIGDPFLIVGGESVGVGLGDKRIWRDRLLSRWVSSGSNITRDRVIALTRSRHFNEVRLIYGYPTAIREICEHLDELGIRPAKLKGVVTTAEPLRPEVRDRIKAVLEVGNVLDQWGLNDGGLHASEGSEEDGLHVSFHRGILEIVDEGGGQINEIGKVGRGIGTTLTNFATPFIRYDTGDQLHWKTFDRSQSGITWARIGPVDGRTGDVIYLPDKTITMPGLTLVMRWIEGLLEYQFIQTGPNDIKVNLKRGGSFVLSEDEVRAYLKNKIDQNVNWTIKWNAAERTGNDKVLIVRNDWLRRRGLDRPNWG